MDQPIYTGEAQQEIVNQVFIQDVMAFEKKKEELEALRKEVDLERKKLELERRSFQREVEFERQRKEREEQLFEMKWKLLETETANLTKEREEFEYRVSSFEANTMEGLGGGNVNPGFLFAGVTDELTLKKRYRDLLKIYHPDNMAGDSKVVVKITEEYERLKSEIRSRY